MTSRKRIDYPFSTLVNQNEIRREDLEILLLDPGFSKLEFSDGLIKVFRTRIENDHEYQERSKRLEIDKMKEKARMRSL